MKGARADRGQTLVLAALLGLLVVVALLATLHVGVAVHERIELQDSADAMAYSIAALEARAFNFYAYANRAQASHYVSAMLLQSLLSFAYFTESFATDVYGVVRTLDTCGNGREGLWNALCPALEAIPEVGPALRFLHGTTDLMEVAVLAYQQTLQESGIDESFGQEGIPLLRTMNSALAHVSSSVAEATLDQVQRGTEEVLRANHRGSALAQQQGSELSACLYDRAHARAANGSPLAPTQDAGLPILPRAREEHDPRARAKRVMAQVASASRHGCDENVPRCLPSFATRRSPATLAMPAWLAPMRGLLETAPKWGTTRLLTYGIGGGLDDPRGANHLREPADAPGAAMAMLAQGDVLASDDPYALAIGPARIGPFANPLSCDAFDAAEDCWGDPRYGRRSDRPYRHLLENSIWATGDDEPEMPRGGLHWRIAHQQGPFVPGWRAPTAPGSPGRVGLNRIRRTLAPGLTVGVYVANVQPLVDGNHRWPGLAPFMHFEAAEYVQACHAAGTTGRPATFDRAAGRKHEFNQPSSWVLLGATEEDRPRFGPWMLGDSGKVELLEGRLQFRRSAAGSLGATAIARAQAYYHRPGNWAEPPNFFNPYWRPRLASVWQGRDELPLIRELASALPEPLRSAPQRAFTH